MNERMKAKPANETLNGRILAAMRMNLLPGFILWCIGLALVCSYYFWTETRPAFEKVIQWKMQYGYVYSALSTAFFGGVIPYFYLRWSGTERIGLHWGHGVLFISYWALRGLDVDAFYRLQAWFFGSDNHWQTIVKKVLVDQFVYCILWASPVTAFFYEWKEADFSLSQWRRQWNSSSLLDKIIVFMVSTWIVWIPATAIVYSLPLPLQIPLFNLTLCFFVLLVSVFSRKNGNPSRPPAEEA